MHSHLIAEHRWVGVLVMALLMSLLRIVADAGSLSQTGDGSVVSEPARDECAVYALQGSLTSTESPRALLCD